METSKDNNFEKTEDINDLIIAFIPKNNSFHHQFGSLKRGEDI
jgi:hypothetical protein